VFEIFGPKRDEVTGGWRKIHNEELHNVYSSLDITRMIKPKRMIWEGHVACIGEECMQSLCMKETTWKT
jgi:hypothetical protein